MLSTDVAECDASVVWVRGGLVAHMRGDFGSIPKPLALLLPPIIAVPNQIFASKPSQSSS